MRECTGDDIRIYETTGSSTMSDALIDGAFGLKEIEDDVTEVVHIRLFHDPESGLWSTVMYVS